MHGEYGKIEVLWDIMLNIVYNYMFELGRKCGNIKKLYTSYDNGVKT